MANNDAELKELAQRLKGKEREDIIFLRNVRAEQRAAEKEILDQARESQEETSRALDEMAKPAPHEVLGLFDKLEDTWVVDPWGTEVNGRRMALSGNKREIRRREWKIHFQEWGGWERVARHPAACFLASVAFLILWRVCGPTVAESGADASVAFTIAMITAQVLLAGRVVKGVKEMSQRKKGDKGKGVALWEVLEAQEGVPPWAGWRKSQKETLELLQTRVGEKLLYEMGGQDGLRVALMPEVRPAARAKLVAQLMLEEIREREENGDAGEELVREAEKHENTIEIVEWGMENTPEGLSYPTTVRDVENLMEQKGHGAGKV